MILKVFYMVYFAGVALFVLNSVSFALFKKATIKLKIKRIFSAVIFSVLFPLSLFSAEGRKVLFNNFNKL